MNIARVSGFSSTFGKAEFWANQGVRDYELDAALSRAARHMVRAILDPDIPVGAIMMGDDNKFGVRVTARDRVIEDPNKRLIFANHFLGGNHG